MACTNISAAAHAQRPPRLADPVLRLVLVIASPARRSSPAAWAGDGTPRWVWMLGLAVFVVAVLWRRRRKPRR